MSLKLFIFVLAVVVVAGLLLLSGTGNDRMETVAPSPREKQGTPPHGHGAVRLALPTISRAQLAVQGADGADLGEVSLAPHQVATLPNTTYRLRLTEFYTHWNWDKRPVNLSYDERNPAVKVEVLLGDSVIYYQWAFRDMEFFRRGGMTGRHPGTETDQLAFTLLSYENLSLPERPDIEE